MQNMGHSIGLPTKLFIAITNSCNVSCGHCLPNSKTAMQSELSSLEIETVINDASQMGVPRIAFTGGEPLLHRELPRFIELAARNGMRVDLETSASLYKPGMIRRLKSHGLKNLCLSLDGAIARDHDEFRGVRGLFERTLNAAREGTDCQLDVRISCSVGRHNLHTALDIVDTLLSASIVPNGLTFVPITPVGRATLALENVVSRAEWLHFYDRFEEKRLRLKLPIKMRIERLFLPEHQKAEFKRLFPHNIDCIARERRYLYINPEGIAYGCALFANTKYSLGNVRENNVRHIWQTSSRWKDFDAPASSGGVCVGCPALLKSGPTGYDWFESDRTAVAGIVPVCPMVQTPQIDSWASASS